MVLLQSYNPCMPVHYLKPILTCIYLMVQKGSNLSQGYLSLGECCGHAPFYQLTLHSQLARRRRSSIILIEFHKPCAAGDCSYTNLALLGIDVCQYKATVSQVCSVECWCSKTIWAGNRTCPNAHRHPKWCAVLPVSVLNTLLAGLELFVSSLRNSCKTKIKTLIKDLSTESFNFQDVVMKFLE